MLFRSDKKYVDFYWITWNKWFSCYALLIDFFSKVCIVCYSIFFILLRNRGQIIKKSLFWIFSFRVYCYFMQQQLNISKKHSLLQFKFKASNISMLLNTNDPFFVRQKTPTIEISIAEFKSSTIYRQIFRVIFIGVAKTGVWFSGKM